MIRELRLYTISDLYIQFLNRHDKRVSSNKEDNRRFERKYLGTVLNVDGIDYFVPLASPKDSDYYLDSNGNKVVRKSIIPILRILHKERNGDVNFLGTLRFSNMLPVLESEICLYDFLSESDLQYKDMVLKQWAFIRQNKNRIYKHARTIYGQKVNIDEDIGYLKNTVDFKLLEQKMQEYIINDQED